MYNGNYIKSGSKVLIHIMYCTVQLSTKAGWMDGSREKNPSPPKKLFKENYEPL